MGREPVDLYPRAVRAVHDPPCPSPVGGNGVRLVGRLEEVDDDVTAHDHAVVAADVGTLSSSARRASVAGQVRRAVRRVSAATAPCAWRRRAAGPAPSDCPPPRRTWRRRRGWSGPGSSPRARWPSLLLRFRDAFARADTGRRPSFRQASAPGRLRAAPTRAAGHVRALPVLCHKPDYDGSPIHRRSIASANPRPLQGFAPRRRRRPGPAATSTSMNVAPRSASARPASAASPTGSTTLRAVVAGRERLRLARRHVLSWPGLRQGCLATRQRPQPESLRVAFPAACGVKCSRQRARRPAHRCTRTAHRFFPDTPPLSYGHPA